MEIENRYAIGDKYSLCVPILCVSMASGSIVDKLER